MQIPPSLLFLKNFRDSDCDNYLVNITLLAGSHLCRFGINVQRTESQALILFLGREESGQWVRHVMQQCSRDKNSKGVSSIQKGARRNYIAKYSNTGGVVG